MYLFRGVILFAMVNGGLPFKESDAKAVLGAMKKPVYFKSSLTSGKTHALLEQTTYHQPKEN